jgi:hypothetical protein
MKAACLSTAPPYHTPLMEEMSLLIGRALERVTGISAPAYCSYVHPIG